MTPEPVNLTYEGWLRRALSKAPERTLTVSYPGLRDVRVYEFVKQAEADGYTVAFTDVPDWVTGKKS